MPIPVQYIPTEALIEVYINYRCATCRRFNCICDEAFMDWYEAEGQ